MTIPDWETLIAERSRPCATMPRCDDTVQQRMKMNDHAYYKRHKDEPEFREKRRIRQSEYRRTDKYRKQHSEYMKEWRKTHPLTAHQRELSRLRNKRYNERKKANEAA